MSPAGERKWDFSVVRYRPAMGAPDIRFRNSLARTIVAITGTVAILRHARGKLLDGLVLPQLAPASLRSSYFRFAFQTPAIGTSLRTQAPRSRPVLQRRADEAFVALVLRLGFLDAARPVAGGERERFFNVSIVLIFVAGPVLLLDTDHRVEQRKKLTNESRSEGYGIRLKPKQGDCCVLAHQSAYRPAPYRMAPVLLLPAAR